MNKPRYVYVRPQQIEALVTTLERLAPHSQRVPEKELGWFQTFCEALFVGGKTLGIARLILTGLLLAASLYRIMM